MKNKNRTFKNCLITGIAGSGGSYLAEHILKKDKKIKIIGLFRSDKYKKTLQKKYKKRIKFIKVDLNNYQKVKKIFKKIRPDLIYNFASDADVRRSFDIPKKIIQNNYSKYFGVIEDM